MVLCVCVTVPLVSPKPLKSKLVCGTQVYVNNMSNSDLLIVKKWLFLAVHVLLTRQLVCGDSDSYKSYPVNSRLISTFLFHPYYACDGDP